MDKVRIGIIGMGRMGITHYSIINTHPSDTSTMITDMLRKYIPTLKTYADYKDLLNAKDIDGVIVCTPSSLHYPVCKLAGENGIAVFCEKPFTTSPDLANELADMFEAKGLVNQVGYVNRYNQVFNRIKEYIDNDVIGKVRFVNGGFYSATVTKPQTAKGWRSKRENGGGVTYEMGAHIFDVLNYLLGCQERVMGSAMTSMFSTTVEDICSANVLYKDGIIASVNVNWSDITYRKPMMKLEIDGEKGKIMADFYGMKVFLREKNEQFNLAEGWTSMPRNLIPVNTKFYVRGAHFSDQLYDFADAIKEGRASKGCSFRKAAETQELIHSIFNNENK